MAQGMRRGVRGAGCGVRGARAWARRTGVEGSMLALARAARVASTVVRPSNLPLGYSSPEREEGQVLIACSSAVRHHLSQAHAQRSAAQGDSVQCALRCLSRASETRQKAPRPKAAGSVCERVWMPCHPELTSTRAPCSGDLTVELWRPPERATARPGQRGGSLAAAGDA